MEEELEGWEVKVEFNKNFSKLNFFNGLSEVRSGTNFSTFTPIFRNFPRQFLKFSNKGSSKCLSGKNWQRILGGQRGLEW